jgi:hypothetical protein
MAAYFNRPKACRGREQHRVLHPRFSRRFLSSICSLRVGGLISQRKMLTVPLNPTGECDVLIKRDVRKLTITFGQFRESEVSTARLG